MRRANRPPTDPPGPAVEIVPEFYLYGEPVQDVDVDFIHVETIAARSRLHNWHIAAHRHHGLHHLLLVTRGGGELMADGVRHRLAAPALVTMPPAVVHGFRFLEETDGWVITLAESYVAELCRQDGGGELIGGLFEPAAFGLDAPAMTTHDLAARFRSVEAEFRWNGPARSAAISAHLRLLLVAVARLRRGEGLQVAARGSDADLLGRFRALVERRFRERDSIDDYARALGTTEHGLARVCARAAGRTPLEIVHARRLVEAKRGLLYTSMTVAEVGYALGFRDPAYFSRFFTRRAGLPPQEFRIRLGMAAGEAAK